MKWYEIDEAERIKKFYSNVTIQNFWDWWSDKEQKFMEVRIKDWKLTKETATRYKLPYSTSGVYVTTGTQLKNVLSYVRDKATVWFGINPRKKNKNLKGWNVFGSADRGGSGDINVEEIKFLFIDIDRKNKVGVAGTKDLEHCDILANSILKKLNTEKWSESYIKIASGHGLQLIVKLDLGLTLPNVEFEKICLPNNENDEKVEPIYKPILNKNFIKTQTIIREGIGKDILKFTRQTIKKKELLVEVDKTCFRMAQVGALHCSKNFKYDTYRWRGIVEIKHNKNSGLADYIWSRETDIKKFKQGSPFVNYRVLDSDKIQSGKLMKHKLIQFVIKNNFSYGEINNKLWFQIKCLIRDSKIDINSNEYISFKRMFEAKIKGILSPNLPDKRFSFSKDMINDFCLNQRLPPIYTVYEKRIKNNNYVKEKDIKFEKRILSDKTFELDDSSTLKEDMQICKEKFKENLYFNNGLIVADFINSIIKKYDKNTAKYICEHWLYKFFEYD